MSDRRGPELAGGRSSRPYPTPSVGMLARGSAGSGCGIPFPPHSGTFRRFPPPYRAGGRWGAGPAPASGSGLTTGARSHYRRPALRPTARWGHLGGSPQEEDDGGTRQAHTLSNRAGEKRDTKEPTPAARPILDDRRSMPAVGGWIRREGMPIRALQSFVVLPCHQ